MFFTKKESSKDEGLNQSQQILGLVEDFRLFPSQEGRPHFEVETSGHKEVWPVESEGAKNIIRQRFYEAFHNLPDSKNIEKALGLLAHQATSLPRENVYSRVAKADNKIYIDLSDHGHNFIEVDVSGWKVVEAVPVNFVRVKSTKPLPMPVRGGKMSDLKGFVNIGSEHDFILLQAFIVGALFEGKQYPIVILQGPQGSAKSTTSDILKSLIDPGAPSLRSLPLKEEDLFIAAKSAHLICYDNLSGINAKISDSLCKISTGCGISGRKLYTNDEEYFIELSRPIVINGIDDLTSRPDLADRALVFTLPKISEVKRVSSTQLMDRFYEARPLFFGCILDALSFALRDRDQIKIESKPRMVDFCLTACAGLQAFGYKPEQTLEAFMANRREVALDTVEANPIGRAIKNFMMKQSYWRGTLSTLSHDMSIDLDRENYPQWSRVPQAISRELNRLAPALLQDGISIDHERKNDKRLIIITKVEKTSSPSSPVTSDNSDGKKVEMNFMRDSFSEGKA